MRVLSVPDLQYPFAHRDHLDFLEAVIEKYKPNAFINQGDEVDFHALGDYDHDPDGFSAGHELEAAVRDLEKLYKIIPKTKVCVSNHTSRPYRRAFKFGIPAAFIKSYKEFLNAPKGWEWADTWEIDNVLYEHGDSPGVSGAMGAIRAALKNMQSTCIGHLHSYAGIQWSANAKHLIFGFNVGCLIDKDKYAFKYGKNLKDKPILGCGIIDAGIPTFIPMLLKPNGRWVGRL